MDRLENVSSNLGQDPIYGSSKSILIIDDDPLARTILRLLFESEGYQCREAENGAMGLAVFEQYQPDLVVTDNNMPVLTGLEFLDRVSKKRKVPAVIVVTGKLTHQIKSRALQSGARAVLEKPYNIGELRILANCLLNAEESIHFGTDTIN